ncbi:MAG: hypothetical protein WDM89_03380 [Rhizomicrobium sp.]
MTNCAPGRGAELHAGKNPLPEAFHLADVTYADAGRTIRVVRAYNIGFVDIQGQHIAVAVKADDLRFRLGFRGAPRARAALPVSMPVS